MRARPTQTANQIDARENISPLIAAAHLQRALESIMQHQIVVGLQQRIAEFSERNTFVRIQAPADGFLAQQIVDGEMFAHVAQELHHGDWAKPVSIVDDARRIAGGVEIKKTAELFFNALEISFDLFMSKQLTLLGLAARISDQTS